MCIQKFDLFTCGHVEKSNHGVSAGSPSPEKCSTHHLKYERANTVCFVCRMHGTEPPEDINVKCVSSNEDQVDPEPQEAPVEPRMLEWLSAIRPGKQSSFEEVYRPMSPSQSSDTHQSTTSDNLETQAYRSEDFHNSVNLTRYAQMNLALHQADSRIGSPDVSTTQESDSEDRQEHAKQVGTVEKAETEEAYIDQTERKQERKNVMNISNILNDETLIPNATNYGQVEDTEKNYSRHDHPQYIQMPPSPLKHSRVEIEPQPATKTRNKRTKAAARRPKQMEQVEVDTYDEAQEIEKARNRLKRQWDSTSVEDFLTPDQLARMGNVQVDWVQHEEPGLLPKRVRGRPRGSRNGSDVWSVKS